MAMMMLMMMISSDCRCFFFVYHSYAMMLSCDYTSGRKREAPQLLQPCSPAQLVTDSSQSVFCTKRAGRFPNMSSIIIPGISLTKRAVRNIVRTSHLVKTVPPWNSYTHGVDRRFPLHDDLDLSRQIYASSEGSSSLPVGTRASCVTSQNGRL